MPRNATVTAETATSCLALASWDFEKVLLEQPALTLSILRGVAARLREVDRVGEALRAGPCRPAP